MPDLNVPIAAISKAIRAPVQYPPRAPPSDPPSHKIIPLPSLYGARPIFRSSTSSSLPMLLPELHPTYKSSTSNEELSPPTKGGDAPNVRTPTPLNFPYT